MPLPTRTTTIGGIKFEMQLLGGRDARAVAVRVKPLVLRAVQALLSTMKPEAGKKLGEVLSGTPAGEKAAKVDSAQLQGLLGAGVALFESLDDVDQEFLVKTFAKLTHVHIDADGNPGEFKTPLDNRLEDLFVGKPYMVDEWLVWAVQQNGFFDLGPLLARLPKKEAGEPSKSPKAATGSSGGSS